MGPFIAACFNAFFPSGGFPVCRQEFSVCGPKIPSTKYPGVRIKYHSIFIGVALALFMVFSGATGFAEEFKSPEEMFKETKYTEEAYYQTERMLLTATKHLMESRTAPAINSVVTADEIRNMGARNVFDVLDKIPGFSTSVVMRVF
jgi:outer membrane receptor for ferric coprogen and ferric-rhodotorulic acid